MVYLSNFSFAVIIELINNLNIQQLICLYQNQNKFYQNKIIDFVEIDKRESLRKIDKNISDSAKYIEDMKKFLIEICNNDNINFKYSATNKDYIEDFTQKELIYKMQGKSKNLINSDSLENLENLIDFIFFISDFSRKHGFLDLDFLFLREKGIKEEFLYNLILFVTCGYKLSNDIKFQNYYEKISFKGCQYLQHGENPNIIKSELYKILKKSKSGG